MGGRERRGSCTNNDTETVLKLYQDPNVLRKAQGLNAQAKGEVLLSRRDGAAEIFLLATTRGSRNLVVSGCGQDIGDDLGLEPPVVLGIHVSVARF